LVAGLRTADCHPIREWGFRSDYGSSIDPFALSTDSASLSSEQA
jgi:hypothetical protein